MVFCAVSLGWLVAVFVLSICCLLLHVGVAWVLICLDFYSCSGFCELLNVLFILSCCFDFRWFVWLCLFFSDFVYARVAKFVSLLFVV